MTVTTNDESSDSSFNRTVGVGLCCGIGAYIIWGGIFPVYFKFLDTVPLLQIVCHRIIWSLLFLSLINCRPGCYQALFAVFKDSRALQILLCTSLLIAANWLLFVYAIVSGQILQASLGYFITPLMNILLGLIFLQERLSRMQYFSLFLAVCGVSVSTWQHGGIPWIALVLALSFAFYGLLRKVVRANALTGLTFETALLAPLAGGYLLFCGWQGTGMFITSGPLISCLLLFAGILTAVPLLLFAIAARRLRMVTIGFLQYLSPTLQFLLAVLVFAEPFGGGQLLSFAFIWTALCCYSWSLWRTQQR